MASSINGGGMAPVYARVQILPDRDAPPVPDRIDGEAAGRRARSVGAGATRHVAGAGPAGPADGAAPQAQRNAGALAAPHPGLPAGPSVFLAQQYSQELLAANDNAATAHGKGVAAYRAAGGDAASAAAQEIDLYLPSLASGHKFDLLV